VRVALTRLSSGRVPRRMVCVGAALLLMACASSQPVVYHRAPPDAQRAAKVATDITQCRQLAAAAVGTHGRATPRAVAKSTARAGIVGFVAEAVEVLVEGSRNAWAKARGVGAGGVAGMVTKTVLDHNEPDDVHKEYVERCMKERGNLVLGWR
jgi:outer membrane lipoprotein SlyB